MMVGIRTKSAVSYVLRTARPIEELEFRHAFLGEDHAEEILAWYRERQNADGGFPAVVDRIGFSTGKCSCVSMTLRNLRRLLLLGFVEADVTTDAIRFLLAHQERDGSFHEISEVRSYAVPEWSVPGDNDVVLWQTTAVVCYALRTPFGKSREVGRGIEFLDGKWTLTDGFVSRFYYPQIYGLGVFGLREGAEEERFAKCAANISKVWGRLPLWQLPLILEICRAAGVGAEHPLVRRVVSRLKISQNPMGYWIDGFSQLGSPQNTIFALTALKSYGAV